MNLKALALSSLLVATLLAGCTGGSDDVEPVDPDKRPDLAEGRGAITGLVIDDIFRPVPGALVFLQGTASTATTDADGQFQILDLMPDTYVALVQSPRHEVAPVNIDVVAGAYAEVEIRAQRLFSEGGYTITTAYSVFIPCAVDYVANGFVRDCTADQSGDSFRAFFVSDYREYGSRPSYLVTEMLANKEGRYEVQIRSTDVNADPCPGIERYAVTQFKGTYTRLVMPYNGTSLQSAEASYGPNDVWANQCKLQTILFPDSEGREELQGAGAPVCCGAGVHFGIRGKFVATLFLGEPEVDIETYCVLAPEGCSATT